MPKMLLITSIDGKYSFTVDGDDISTNMLTRCRVPESVAQEIVGLMHVINGSQMYSYGYTPEWYVDAGAESVEVRTEINHTFITFERRW